MTAGASELTAPYRPLLPPSGRRVRWWSGGLPVSALVGTALIAVVVVVGLAGPLLVPYAPDKTVDGGLVLAFQGPSADHWFGLDGQGRDVLSRIVSGARLTLLVGIGAVLIGAVAGTLIGGFAAVRGGVVGGALMRATDLLLAFPALLLALGLVAVLGQGRLQVILAVGITTVPVFARLVHGEVTRQLRMDYVSAALMQGLGGSRILFRHLLPNSLTVVVAQGTLLLSTAVIEVAALGYLGLGPADAGSADWGGMLTEATTTLRSHPLLLLWPSLALVVTALGFNLLGNGLQARAGSRR